MSRSMLARVPVLALLVAMCIPASNAAQVRLGWDPPRNARPGEVLPAVAGYVLRYGTASAQHTVVRDVGNATETVVTNLAEGTTYYFTIRFYTTGHDEECEDALEWAYRIPDATPPQIVPPPAQVLAAGAAGTAVIPDLIAQTQASDNVTPSGSLLMSQSPAAGYVVGLGICNVTLTATDLDGNTATAATSITVADVTAPAIQPPVPVTIKANRKGKASVPNFLTALVVTDNCTPRVSLRLSQSPAAGTMVSVGTRTVTLRATDAAGNASSATVLLTVIKYSAPSSAMTLADSSLPTEPALATTSAAAAVPAVPEKPKNLRIVFSDR